MPSNTNSSPSTQPAGTPLPAEGNFIVKGPVLVTDPACLPASLRPIATEIATYRRELPRLLREGHEGRAVLIRGDTVVGIWDSRQDAVQAGRERYGLEPFLAHRIDARDLDRLTL